MGNCQAAEAASVVIQHPGGKVERLYGAATAAEVMRGNPGHYVALVVLSVSGVGGKQEDPAPSGTGARITKVKLLKPKDTLLLGQFYRLITSQEVAKAIQARREDKMRRRRGGGGRPAGPWTTRRRRGGQPRAGAAVHRPGTEAAGEGGPAAPERRRQRAALAAVAAEHLRGGELTPRD